MIKKILLFVLLTAPLKAQTLVYDASLSRSEYVEQLDDLWSTLKGSRAKLYFDLTQPGTYRAELLARSGSTGSAEPPIARVSIFADGTFESETLQTITEAAWYPIIDLPSFTDSATILIQLDNDDYLVGVRDVNLDVKALQLISIADYDTFEVSVEALWSPPEDKDIDYYNVLLRTPDMKEYEASTSDSSYKWPQRFAQYGVYHVQAVTIDTLGNESLPSYAQTIVPFEQIFRPVNNDSTTVPQDSTASPVTSLKTILTFTKRSK